MFYVLSKTIWTFADPANFLLLILALACASLWTRLKVWGRAALASISVLLVTISVIPLGGFAMNGLEQRFPPAQYPDDVAGIIALGGAVDAAAYYERPGSGINSAVGRIFEAARLARRYPSARLVLSGGPPSGPGGGKSESDAARQLLIELGVPPERIELEVNSRNTFENALFVKNLVKPLPGQRWLLVTSAFHMPRAMGCFRAVGFQVSAFPVDYKYDHLIWPRFDLFDGLSEVKYALHEYVGLTAYWMSGKTKEWVPGP